MKSIVTGGCGFIGSHVVDSLLKLGHDVVVIDNLSTGRRENLNHCISKVKIIEADISTPGDWQKEFKNSDWVIHLAALADIVPSIKHPNAYFQSNVVGTFNVLEAARNFETKRFIYAASSSCYGLAKEIPTTENAPISPEYPYALTKRLGEEQVLHWAKVYGLPANSLRFFNVYGTRSRTSGTYGAMFGVFLAQKLAGKPFTIVGDGTQTRDFTYVTDIANGIVATAMSNVTGEIFNLGSGKTVSVNRVVELLGGPKVHIPKRPGEPDCTFADISKIKSHIGWTPQVTIENGVAELLKNIDYWRNAPVWDPESIARETTDWFKFLGKEKTNG